MTRQPPVRVRRVGRRWFVTCTPCARRLLPGYRYCVGTAHAWSDAITIAHAHTHATGSVHHPAR